MNPESERIRTAVRGARGVAVILSANPIHDTGGGQRSAQLALELLERGWAVVFVSHGEVTETVDLGLRHEHERLVALGLADTGDEQVREAVLDVVAGGSGDRERSLLVTQVPARAWLPLLERASGAAVVTVYDCIDRWDSELGRGWYRRSVEERVADASSVLTASAPALVDHLETLTGREAVLLPNAYNARIFDPGRAPALGRPGDLPTGERVALYVGALWGGWMDWGLAREAARAAPETVFVFVGDHRGEGRRLPGNCHFLGLKPQTSLPAYLAHADVAFLPWRSGEVTEATSPLKVYEFVAMGLPVVAPDLEPLRGIPGVRTLDDEAGFVRALAEIGRDGLAAEERREMRDFAAASSWGDRVDRLLALQDARMDAGAASARAGAASASARADAGAASARAGRALRSRAGATLSVVVPAFEHERYVGEAVDSVARQTLPAAELVVVDDGSRDGTADVVAARRLAGLRLIRQENRGAHHALNRAIRLSRGEYVAILNSDDAFEPERLEHAWGVARATGAALVLGSVRLIAEHGGEVDPSHEIAAWYREARAWAEHAPTLRVVLRRHNVAVTTSNFFMHRELWSRLGGFRAYRYVHDYDFLLRALELCGDRVVYDESIQDVLYRVHGANTITESHARAVEERREMVRARSAPLARVRRFFSALGDARAVRAAVDRTGTLTPVGGGVRERAVERERPVVDDGARLRVGLVVDSLGKGGLEEVVSLLALSLPSQGVDTFVLCARSGGPVARRLERAGVDVEVLEGRFDRAGSWARRTGVVAASSHFASVEVVERLTEAGVPVVETVQNCYVWLDDAGWARERRRLEAARGTIAVSETAGSYFHERTGHRPERIVPNSVHPGRVARVPRPFARRHVGVGATRPVFAFVGRITEQKNPAGLVDAFAGVVEQVPDAILLLAGPADRSAPVGSLRRRHRVLFRRGSVRHLPRVRHVGTVLSAADAFVADSFFEGWSVAASEAAWVGLPLVLSDVGGSRELVGEGSARGTIVPNPVGDPLAVTKARISDPPRVALRANEEALTAALLDVARNLDGWRARAGEIRAWARTRLAPEVQAGRYAEILRRIAEGEGP